MKHILYHSVGSFTGRSLFAYPFVTEFVPYTNGMYALCETMLCECTPVGTKYCGIPTAIGDNGFYASYGDEKATAEAIKKALNAPDEAGKKARERIKKMFLLTWKG